MGRRSTPLTSIAAFAALVGCDGGPSEAECRARCGSVSECYVEAALAELGDGATCQIIPANLNACMNECNPGSAPSGSSGDAAPIAQPPVRSDLCPGSVDDRQRSTLEYGLECWFAEARPESSCRSYGMPRAVDKVFERSDDSSRGPLSFSGTASVTFSSPNGLAIESGEEKFDIFATGLDIFVLQGSMVEVDLHSTCDEAGGCEQSVVVRDRTGELLLAAWLQPDPPALADVPLSTEPALCRSSYDSFYYYSIPHDLVLEDGRRLAPGMSAELGGLRIHSLIGERWYLPLPEITKTAFGAGAVVRQGP